MIATSYTRTAAAVLAGKDLEIPKENVATLHALCFRALDRPKIAETKVAEFNEAHPEYQVSSQIGDIDDGVEVTASAARGDHAMASLQLLRSRMTPEEMWPESVKGFNAAWSDWKKQTGMMDFTDLIETCLRDVEYAPGTPAVMFNDEAQDMSTLQYSLVRKWAEHMDHMVCLFDDDQLIQSFTGAEVKNLIDGECASSTVLNQSYRLPRSIYAAATAWIGQCSHRMEKVWAPRDAEGSVERLNGSWRSPNRIVDEVARISDSGKTVMVLGSCGYMLQPLLKEMRSRGMLFYNPFRPTRGDWNPIRQGEGSALSRLKAFLVGADISGRWSAAALALWTPLLDGDLLVRGARKKIEEMAKENPAMILDAMDWMPFFKADPFGFDPPTLDWLEANLKEAKKKTMQYPLKLLKENRVNGGAKPRIIVGTVHSIKGGEADATILFPDLSLEGDKEWRMGGEQRDSVRRVFYVGLTRSRERLLIADAAGPTAVRLI